MDDDYDTARTATPTTSVNVTGLASYTNYTIHVRAIIAAETIQTSETDIVGDADREIVIRTDNYTEVVIEGGKFYFQQSSCMTSYRFDLSV